MKKKLLRTSLVLGVVLLFIEQAKSQKIDDINLILKYYALPLIPLTDSYKTFQSSSFTPTKRTKTGYCIMTICYLRKTDNFIADQYKKSYFWDFIPSKEEWETKYLTFNGLKKVDNNGDLIIELTIGNIDISKIENKQIKNSQNIAIDHYSDIEYSYESKLLVKDKTGKTILSKELTSPNKKNYSKYPEGTMKIKTSQYDECVFISSQIAEKEFIAANNILKETKPQHIEKEIIQHSISSKNLDYNDYMSASHTFQQGLSLYNNQTYSIAGDSLKKSIVMFNEILTKFDLNDKKARINTKVAGVINYNLFIANILIDNYEECSQILPLITGIRKEEKVKQFLQSWLDDAKTRYNANLKK